MIDVSVLVDKLNQMTCGEIRQFLFLERIQGVIGDKYECPLAQWIRRESDRWVAVGTRMKVAENEYRFGVSVYADSDDWHETPSTSEHLIGKGPEEFIGAFENNRYPELISVVEDND